MTPLRILLDQSDPIRAYKLVTADGNGPFNGGIHYEIGQSYSVDEVEPDEFQECGAGLNLATLSWCLNEWKTGYRILVIEHTAADIVAIPIATDGKYRVRRCTVIGEKSLSECGYGPWNPWPDVPDGAGNGKDEEKGEKG